MASSSASARPVAWCFRLFFNSGQGQELDTGLLLHSEECIPMVVAIAHVYLAHIQSDDPNATGKKPRLRQMLAQQGVAWYLRQVLRSLPFAVHRHSAAIERSAGASLSYRHIGIYPQRQSALAYLGVVLPSVG
jgi:ferredoxin-nitrite reductase